METGLASDSEICLTLPLPLPPEGLKVCSIIAGPKEQ